MKLLFRALITIGVLWSINLYFGDQLFNAFKTPAETELPKEDIQKQINSELPKYIEDSDIRWDSFELKSHIAIYKYTLTNVTKAELGDVYFDADMHQRLVVNVCRTKGIEPYVKNDIAFRFSFYDSNNEFIKSIHAESDQCKFISY